MIKAPNWLLSYAGEALEKKVRPLAASGVNGFTQILNHVEEKNHYAATSPRKMSPVRLSIFAATWPAASAEKYITWMAATT